MKKSVFLLVPIVAAGVFAPVTSAGAVEGQGSASANYWGSVYTWVTGPNAPLNPGSDVALLGGIGNEAGYAKKAKKVKIQQKLNSRWKTVEKVKVRKGKFRTTVEMPHVAEVQYRAKVMKPKAARKVYGQPITVMGNPNNLAVPGSYGLYGGYQGAPRTDIDYGQPVRVANSEFDDTYAPGAGEIAFRIPVTVTNNSQIIIDGRDFTYIGDPEAGVSCRRHWDNKEIARLQPGHTGYGDILIICPASAAGKTFTAEWAHTYADYEWQSGLLIGRVP